MKRLLIALSMLVLLLVSSALGFDGVRKGFVLGGGLGLAPVASWKVDVNFGPFGITSLDETGLGLGLNLVIGYAWDEQNMIVYEGNVAAWSSDLLNQTMSQGFNGAA